MFFFLHRYHECGCVDPFRWIAKSIILPGTNQTLEAPLCDILDQCFINATTRIMNTNSIWDEFCSHCSQKCSNADFTITPSSVSAPSKTFEMNIKNFVENSGIPLPDNWTTIWRSEIHKNYVAVDVVCETNQVENYTQDASISGADLISNVGGQTGLWIGISFLSLMEVVEMVYRLIRYQYYVVRRKRRQNKN